VYIRQNSRDRLFFTTTILSDACAVHEKVETAPTQRGAADGSRVVEQCAQEGCGAGNVRQIINPRTVCPGNKARSLQNN
jgi:hypothetical protein